MNTKMFAQLLLISCLGFSNAFVSKAQSTQISKNKDLVPSNSFTVRGDVTSAGIGLRGKGRGEIVLSNIPAGASIHRAFLYWATIGNVNTYTSPTLEDQAVEGNLIGTSADTCWKVQNNFVYRADVTSLVDGNGSYTVAGLPSDLSRGNDSQGASLVVVYLDDNQPFRTILINDGAVTLDFSKHFFTDTLDNFHPNKPVRDAKVTYLIGDGQAKWEEGNVSFNGVPITAGVFSGIDGGNWGTHTFEVTNLVSDAPATTTINNNDPDNPRSPDCLLWAATIFSVTAEQPEQNRGQLTLFKKYTLFGDVTAAGAGMRGVGEGSIDISSIPANARIQNAYLYWATIGNSSWYLSPTLQGQRINGELVGVSADTCWGALHNYVYRADVTALVQGNGSYLISGLPSNLAAGNDSQGASLVIVYHVPGLYRTIVVHDGAVSLDLDHHSYSNTFAGFTADQPEAQAYITYVIGDGQSRWTSGNVSFEGTSIANNVFNGVDGDAWGTLTFDVTGLVSEPRSTTTINNNVPDNPVSPDCLLWAATIFSVETEPPAAD